MYNSPLLAKYLELIKQLNLIDCVITNTQTQFVDERIQAFRMQKFEEILREIKELQYAYWYAVIIRSQQKAIAA